MAEHGNDTSNDATTNPLDIFLASELGARAVAKIQNKKYDTESWSILIKEAAQKSIQDVRPFYEELVKLFPTCGRFWRAYVEHELKLKRYDRVEKLFTRCLIKVLNIDLWKCYLNYIKEAKAGQPQFNERMGQAYDFALDKIGVDAFSYTVWNDYVQFLRDSEVNGSYMENQKITAVRRAYQRGVVNPMIHIEALWKDYIAYEQSINPLIAERMIQDRSRDYMNARRVAKEWEVTIRGLNRSMPSVPPTGLPDELRQVEIWRKYIQWEKSNPLRTEDNLVILKRVVYAYEQCLLCLGHQPDVWYEYATFLEEQSRLMSDKGDVNKCKQLQDDVAAVYDRAIKGLLRECLLLHFAFADFEEALNERQKATKIYDNLITQGHEQGSQIDLTLVYIQYMKFTRRTEGIIAARGIFKKARDDPKCKHQIYTAAALMEYSCNKQHLPPCKIFEIGLKKFSSCSDYILSYIHFVSQLNEENNTRVLFERVLTTGSLQPKDTIEIWNSFLEFESNIGDLSSIIKVEKRRAQALEKVLSCCTDTSWVVDRYKFQDLVPCSLPELRSIGYEPRQSITSPSSMQGLISALSLNNASSMGQMQQMTHRQQNGNQKGGVRSNSDLLTNYSQAYDILLNSDSNPASNLLSNQSSICQPNLNQMLPFKPCITSTSGSHTVQGGVFPPPPSVKSLLSRLPPPGTFWGPFVDIDELMNLYRQIDFDQLYASFQESRRDIKRVKKMPRNGD